MDKSIAKCSKFHAYKYGGSDVAAGDDGFPTGGIL